jgi:cold-inducible RNA-binding protein
VSNNKGSSERQIFVGNLHYGATEEDLREAFKVLDIQIGDVRIVRDKETNRPKGFAFVDIADEETLSTDSIIANVTGVEFQGRPCRADRVNERPARESVHVPEGRRPQQRRDEKPRRPGRGRRRDSVAGVWDED